MSDVRLTTGSFDFSYGCDSSRVPLVASPVNPNGLPRNALAWMDNCTVRGGGILQRTGFDPLCKVHDGSAIYQRGWLYDNSELGGNPYLMLSIGGRMYQVRVDTDNSVHDVTVAFQDPLIAPKAWFAQQGRFMVKQAGDGGTPPLFWDGNLIRRSKGITNPSVLPGTPGVNEIPPATAMIGYMDRLWYVQNRKLSAGDIEGGNSGTLPYNFEDAVLEVTENPLAVGGDGFSVPGTAGNIRGLAFPIALDQTLGQGPLFAFTTKQIYALQVPITRTDWLAAGSNNQPYFPVVMNKYGTVSDTSIVPVNGDLFYQTIIPDIRSYFMALRYFQTWGNGSISNNINRILQFNNRALAHMSSGIAFGNRLYQTVLPFQTPVGVAFESLVVMDLDPLSTLQDQKPPVWEGNQEGLNFLQLFEGDFGGLERAFAVVQSGIDGGIYVWEITNADRFDQGSTSAEKRVNWWFELPAQDWSEYPRSAGGGPMELKELDGLDLWFDKIFGEVLINVQYRQDQNPCWINWLPNPIKLCYSRTSCENLVNPVCYPYPSGTNREGYQMPICLPKPFDPTCTQGRPSTWGFSFQIKITITGWCRFRGFHLHSLPKKKSAYYAQACAEFASWQNSGTPFQPVPPQPVPPATGTALGDENTGNVFGDENTGNVFGAP
jgi:hypothetical protein